MLDTYETILQLAHDVNEHMEKGGIRPDEELAGFGIDPEGLERIVMEGMLTLISIEGLGATQSAVTTGLAMFHLGFKFREQCYNNNIQGVSPDVCI